ncbi:cellulase family glycosylhydrolase [Pseudomonas indica]|uniref:Aryl-phospho-beta-D-glucosidase BglC, GH1 family n=1 Tax=Pseudomonas indica TaxID=137658 RepID=A0A1G9J4U3_9PSED|nr:cellulase family glycosylhydrolase [Pseudomonas indica]SDL32266.1 Aryl-phospho-beta-D-glucosidase BglC, GH1 family [Pseudomonas indica]
MNPITLPIGSRLAQWSLAGLAGLYAMSSLAGPIASGEYMIKSVQSNKCIDVAGEHNGANVQQYNCWSGANNQRFLVTDLGNDAYSIQPRHTMMSLSAAGAGTVKGTNLEQASWSGAAHQQWEVRSVSGGHEIRPRHATGLCVDVAGASMNDGANLLLWTCHGGNNQKWVFTRMDDGASTGGTATGEGQTTTVNGISFASKSTGGAGAEDSWNIWSDGYIEQSFAFSNPSSLSVMARGEVAGGVWPAMTVSVGGTQVASFTVNSSEWKSYNFDVTGKTGSQAVRVAFTNDAIVNGEDRNLLVKSVSVTTSGDTGSDETTETTTPTANALVAQNGQLRVSGVNLVNAAGQPIQLAGMSSHGLQWFGHLMNASSIKWLRDDWKANVVRAAMYTADGGYISNPSVKDKVVEIVDAAIQNDMYVIIDWHILNDNDPNIYKTQAIEFFREMATRYGNRPNVIYEIANEPNGYANWNDHIRPYAVDVINAIRQIDPDNVVLVGTGTWSQDIHQAADNPLKDPNVMYTLHFYAGTHGQELRDRIDYARNKGAAILVSEWGTSQASGGGGVYANETRTWINFLNQRAISWVNWNLSDKGESSAALAPGASATGGWTSQQLSDSGRLVRELMRNR